MKKFFVVILLSFIATEINAISIAIAKYRGGDWYNNIDSIKNLIKELTNRTSIKVDKDLGIVDLASREIFEYDFVYISGHTPINFNKSEIRNIRDYLINYTGFIFVNDDYGMDESFRKEIKKVFPEFELIEVTFDHPIYHCFYRLKQGLPKVHEHSGGAPKGYGIFINGKLSLFYTYNTDIGDGWDDKSVHGDPEQVREEAIKMGINIVVYSLVRFGR